jgi:hypothetical protein
MGLFFPNSVDRMLEAGPAFMESALRTATLLKILLIIMVFLQLSIVGVVLWVVRKGRFEFVSGSSENLEVYIRIRAGLVREFWLIDVV